MILFPAIDILHGKAVRLLGGDYNRSTVYGDPLEIAKRFADAGATWLHVVDLNGAANDGNNFGMIERIVKATGLNVEAGGGFRNRQRIVDLLNAGGMRAVLGTVCATEPETVGEFLSEFGAEAVVCGLDVKDGCVAVRGWKETSPITPLALGKKLVGFGAKYFLFTDVSRDGMLTGVNVEATVRLAEDLHADVIASGGVKDIGDLARLKEKCVYGAVLGKAYYENKIKIEEAIALCAN